MNPLQFVIDIKDTLQSAVKGLNLSERVEAMARELRFRPFALPLVPDSIKHLVLVEYNNRRYRLDDPELQGTDSKQHTPITPSDVVHLSDEDLGQLLAYWTGVEAVYGSSLAKLLIEKKESERKHKRSERLVEASLQGKINPETDKKYTDAARRELAKIDPNVLEAEDDLADHDVTYIYAESIYKGVSKIKELLNRERMRREMVNSKYTPSYQPRSDPRGIRKPPGRPE